MRLKLITITIVVRNSILCDCQSITKAPLLSGKVRQAGIDQFYLVYIMLIPENIGLLEYAQVDVCTENPQGTAEPMLSHNEL